MDKPKHNIAQRIVDAIEDAFDYTIPIDPKEGSEGLILNYIFSERDSEKMNQMVCCLLKLKDYEIKGCVWRNFPLNFENYKLCPELEAFAKKRAAILEEGFHREGNIYNRTLDIPFERGVITPLCKIHKLRLHLAIHKEKRNDLPKDYREEIETIDEGVDIGNCNEGEHHDDGLSFAILTDNSEMVGYIKLTLGGYFSMRNNIRTYNLEYYTFPEHRRKGFMKEALGALMQAVSEDKILFVDGDPMFNYFVEPEILSIKILNAIIAKKNVSSIKTIEAVGGFKKQGVIKWASGYDDANVVIDEAVVFTRVF